MRNRFIGWVGVFALFVLGAVPQAAYAQQWSSGYWTGANSVPLSSVQWNALTHIVHVNTEINGDGSIQYKCSFGTPCTESQMASEGAAVISAAHSHGVKVLSYVGTGTGTSWTGGTNSTNLASFVSNEMHVVNTYGYDGIVLDWEGPAYNFTQMGSMFSSFRAQLGSKPIVTTVVVTFSYATGFASVQSNVDRFDVMSFDLGGPNPTWFNSPLNSDNPNPNNYGSLAFNVQILESAGIPAGKLDPALAFYGELQTGATGPRQSASVSVAQRNYNTILNTWPSFIAGATMDNVAQVPWFAPNGSSWVNYDNAASITAKVNYCKSHNLGGWFIWALDQDYFSAQVPQHPLMNAVALARGSTTLPPNPPTGLTATVQ